MTRKVFTIGHSNLEIHEFINLLKQHNITALGDVRSHSYSRYLPHFNKDNLKKALLDANISYLISLKLL